MGFESQIDQALRELEQAGLRRYPRGVSGAQGPVIRLDGREVVCLCSNNYLGLASHPDIAAAATADPAGEGVGAGASRLVTGTMDAHEEAEAAFAAFASKPSSVFFATGYAANLGTIQALVGPEDAVFSDALNHASLVDGCRLSRATVHVFRHADPSHLEELLRLHRARARRALVVTDSLFSMDGDLAPIADLDGLARTFDAALLVDEAHALGVLGPEGRGACAAAGVEPTVLVGTLGKSFGVAGAFVASSASIASFIRNRARSFVFSTAPPPMLARASVAALRIVRGSDDARSRLLAHARRLRKELASLGFDVPDGASQIVPVLIGQNEPTMRVSADLLERGVFVQGIRPPTVPRGTARLRLTPMATHAREHIEQAIDAFAGVARNHKEATR